MAGDSFAANLSKKGPLQNRRFCGELKKGQITMMNKTEALALLKEYNKEEFHLAHGQTVSACMEYFANKLG